MASAPAATRAAVSRALARSSTLRTSRWPNFRAPPRSAWPGRGRCDLVDLGLDRPRVHPLLPVRVIAVRDQERDRAAERAPVTDARAHLDRVALDLHPPAAAVTELAARQLAVDPLAVELEPRGQPLDDGDEPGPVRLAGGCKLKSAILRLMLTQSGARLTIGSGAAHMAPGARGSRGARVPDAGPRYQATRSVAEPKRDDSTYCQEGGERDPALARPRAVPRDQRDSEPGGADEADQQRERRRRAEVDTHRRGELDVAHAHATGIDERDREQPAARDHRGDGVLRQRIGLGRGDDRDPGDSPGSTSAFGMTRRSRSVSVTAASNGHSARPSASPARVL